MKFSDIAQPSDQLRIEVRLIKRLGEMMRVKVNIFKKKQTHRFGRSEFSLSIKGLRICKPSKNRFLHFGLSSG